MMIFLTIMSVLTIIGYVLITVFLIKIYPQYSKKQWIWHIVKYVMLLQAVCAIVGIMFLLALPTVVIWATIIFPTVLIGWKYPRFPKKESE